MRFRKYAEPTAEALWSQNTIAAKVTNAGLFAARFSLRVWSLDGAPLHQQQRRLLVAPTTCCQHDDLQLAAPFAPTSRLDFLPSSSDS
jgi:hypothetical protein